MTLKECYDSFGGNYEDVLSRLMDDKRIQRFAFKFLDDTNFETLCECMEKGNYEDAFRAAHTIKGLCLNLGFERLRVSSDALTEALRGGKSDGAEGLLEKVRADYTEVKTALAQFKEQQPV